jgi:hypothetical protein
MVKSCVFFEVRTEFLNIIYTSFGFKGLIPGTATRYPLDGKLGEPHDPTLTLSGF